MRLNRFGCTVETTGTNFRSVDFSSFETALCKSQSDASKLVLAFKYEGNLVSRTLSQSASAESETKRGRHPHFISELVRV